MRHHWNGHDPGVLRAAADAFAAIGVQHLMVGPVDRNVDDWGQVIAGAAKLIG